MIWFDQIEHIEQFITFTNLLIHKFANFFYLCPIKRNTMLNRNTSWNAPYTFSSKEKDVETGYGYFGARYYDSGLSIWLSVDPMSDKYPNMSPYNYCANNPVILVDPDGRDWYQNENGKVLWDDNVTKETGAPKGSTYIGASNNDLVSFFGFTPGSKTDSDWQIGFFQNGEANEGYSPDRFDLTSTIRTEAKVETDKNAISETNKSGKVFKGIEISCITNVYAFDNPLGETQSSGALSLEYGGKDYSSGHKLENKTYNSGCISMTYSSSFLIPSNVLRKSNQINSITNRTSFSIMGSDGQYRPFVYWGGLPIPNSCTQRFKK